LLITAVISILAIQFTQTARNQLSIASMVVDRIQAQAYLRTAESELLFSLLTEPLKKSDQTPNQYVKSWNFYGEPFVLDNQNIDGVTQEQDELAYVSDDMTADTSNEVQVTVTMQDQNSLVTLFKGQGATMLGQLIIALNAENSGEVSDYRNDKSVLTDVNASIAVNSLVDWQDGDDSPRINGAESSFYNTPGMPTNLPLQTLKELRHIRGFSDELLAKLTPYVTIRGQTYFNPMQSPEMILKLLMSADRAAEIVQLRKSGMLDKRQFQILSGLEDDESVGFDTSGLLRIQIEIAYRDVNLKKNYDYFLQPYDSQPIVEFMVSN